MKKAVYPIIIFLVSIQTIGISQGKTDGRGVKGDSVAVDSLEYRLVVFDIGFETWLLNKPPMSYYSNLKLLAFDR